MAIEATERKSIAAGQTLVAKYKGTEYRLAVTALEDGALRYDLADGRTFRSLSAAGSAIMLGVSCNGWRFFSVEGTSPSPTKAATRAVKRSTAAVPEAAGTDAEDAPTPKPRPQCARCGKTFVGATQLAHHEANADRLCAPA